MDSAKFKRSKRHNESRNLINKNDSPDHSESDSDEDFELETDSKQKGKKRPHNSIKEKSQSNHLLKKQNDKLSSDGLKPVLTGLSMEEKDRSYEEWMKIAADNKINSSNTWNSELIDYFSKLTFFRDGNSINFQKASCTLDNCIKVYTSRVDSVVSETGLLLNGLSESTETKKKELEEEFEDSEKPAKKSSSRSEQTLAKDISVLNSKSLEKDYFVDPLFKKKSADFDEGGARGLLINNLFTRGDGRLIFDATDADMNVNPRNSINVDVYFDRTKLNLGPLIRSTIDDDLLTQELCPSLRNFSFGTSLSLDVKELRHLQEDNVESDGFLDIPEEYEDFFEEFTETEGGIASIDQQNEVFIVENNLTNEPDLNVEAPFPAVTQILANSENIFSYLDDRFSKNWAGPEHWKLKPHLKVANGEKPSNSSPKPKIEKIEFEVDFFDTKEIDLNEVFSKDETVRGIRRTDKEEGLLPFDHKFSSKAFLGLFNKPDVSFVTTRFVQDKTQGTLSTKVVLPNENFFGPMDDSFDATTPGDSGTNTSPSTPMSALYNPDSLFDLNTTFLEKQLEGNNYGDHIMPTLKRIQAAKINYMKISKNVDVKLLKENIWNKLLPDDSNNNKELTQNESSGSHNISKKHSFSTVIKSLSTDYKSKTSFKDLSVPFCFICLLHLANEHNLEIEDNREMSELVIKQEIANKK